MKLSELFKEAVGTLESYTGLEITKTELNKTPFELPGEDGKWYRVGFGVQRHCDDSREKSVLFGRPGADDDSPVEIKVRGYGWLSRVFGQNTPRF